jgi:hypothetical protein
MWDFCKVLIVFFSALDLTANLQVVVQRDEGALDKNGGPTVTSSLLNPSVDVKESSKRYETSELHQFWIILKRALLFSRRDWVSLSAPNSVIGFHLSTLLSDFDVPAFVCPYFGWIFDWRALLRYWK